MRTRARIVLLALSTVVASATAVAAEEPELYFEVVRWHTPEDTVGSVLSLSAGEFAKALDSAMALADEATRAELGVLAKELLQDGALLPTFDHGEESWFFDVVLDGDPLKEEAHFRECTGLDPGVAGGRDDGGPPRLARPVLRRGVTKSKAFVKWIFDAANRGAARMGGKIALCKRDGTPFIEWTFEKAWPCMYASPPVMSGFCAADPGPRR